MGADYLLIHPTFSQAIAFATGTQTPTSYQTEAQQLTFDYQSSLRAFLGYRFDEDRSAVQFTYSYIDSETRLNGAVSNPGNFIVDPFGNIAGSVVVINPSDARFGQTLTGGDAIQTMASVRMNVFDVDFIRSFDSTSSRWDFRWSLGARIANVDQYYDSIITLGGATLTRGVWSADFTGAGPRLGLEAERYFGDERRFSLLANAHGSLLVGSYDTTSSNSVVPVGFAASQSTNLTRIIPVMEMEVGATWRPVNHLSLNAGWLFQSWFDLGTSGGTFGGLFAGTENANIMAFDGLYARAEWKF